MPLVQTATAAQPSPVSATAPMVSAMVNRKVSTERISAQLEQLGPLPTIAMEIVNITNNPDSNAKQLEEKISRDPVITAKVFKLANSAFYCKGSPSQTLQAAGARLGMNTIKNLVLSSCAGKMMAKPLEHYAYEGFGMWKHSLALALIAMQMPREVGLKPSRRDDLFLGGMMHDIGKLIVDPLLGDDVNQTGTGSIQLEHRLLGITHPSMGVEIAERWNLPAFAVEVIRHHHAPAEADAEEDLVAAIHVLDNLVNAEFVGLVDDAALEDAPAPAALEILGLGEDGLAALRESVSEKLPEVIELCGTMV